MTKPAPACRRTTHRTSCNEALKRRGSLQVWLNRDMDRVAPKAGKPGRPSAISDAAIQFCLVVLFAPPLRQKSITVQSSSRQAQGPMNLMRPLGASLGASQREALPGDKQHRQQVRKRRRRAAQEARDASPPPNRKVHLAMDAAAKGSHRTARTVASARRAVPLRGRAMPSCDRPGALGGESGGGCRATMSAAGLR